jgi:AraC-like DNA-binding protein
LKSKVDIEVTEPVEQQPNSLQPITKRARSLRNGERFPSHCHDWDQISLTTSGSALVFVEGPRDVGQIATPNCAVWIPAGVNHALEAVGDCSYVSIYFDKALDVLPRSGLQVLGLRPLARALVLELQPTMDCRKRDHYLSLVAFMREELRLCSLTPADLIIPKDRRLKALCLHVLDNLQHKDNWSITSTKIGISPRNVSRLSQKELGMTFARWRAIAVQSYAKGLIDNGLPMGLVSDKCGFSSYSAFHRQFRSVFGCAPSALFR